METKYVRVPFDVELAKEITEKSVDGRIVTRNGESVRVLCFDRKGTHMPIIALVEIKDGEEDYFSYYENGHYDICDHNSKDLMLEITEYMAFKDGDILICECGTPFIYKDTKDRHGNFSAYCGIDLKGNIFFDMKGWTCSIKGHANEEQKKIIIDALKTSKEPKAKEYLKRFFPNHSNSSNIGKNCEFKPFDKVLVRDNYSEKWSINFFSYMKNEDEYIYCCLSQCWKQCIPYNEDTAHLLGTTEKYE